MVTKYSPCQSCGEQVQFRAYPMPYCKPCQNKIRETNKVKVDCLKCGGTSYTGNLCEDCQRTMRGSRKTIDEILTRNRSQKFRKERTDELGQRLDG